MSENRRVVITGLGIASPIGCDVDSFWSALQNGQSGVEQIRRIAADNLTTQIGGEVHDFGHCPYLKIFPKIFVFDVVSNFNRTYEVAENFSFFRLFETSVILVM